MRDNKRKRIEFTCKRCSKVFVATVCVSSLCPECRKLPPGEAPFCACGCEQKTAWLGNIKGGHWNKFIHGHHVNVSNPGFKKGHETWNAGHRQYNGKCTQCGEEFESSYPKTLCSRKCKQIASRGYATWSKGLTKETDPRLKVMGEKVSEIRQSIPVHNKGKTRNDYEPLRRAGERISEVLSVMISEGRLTIASPNSYFGWMENKSTGGREFFRSSYEAAYMHILNEKGIKWTTRHGIIIWWRDDSGDSHRYVPDFQVWISEDKFEIHEIKPSCFLKDGEVVAKKNSAIRKGLKDGWEYKIITEKDVKEFSKFIPEDSKWFIGYDNKTIRHFNTKTKQLSLV